MIYYDILLLLLLLFLLNSLRGPAGACGPRRLIGTSVSSIVSVVSITVSAIWYVYNRIMCVLALFQVVFLASPQAAVLG